MGDRNTIVAVALVVFVALTAVCSGVAFYYSLESEDLGKSLEAEKKLTGKLNLDVSDQGEIPKLIVKLKADTEKLDTEQADTPEAGGIQQMKKHVTENVEAFITAERDKATEAHKKREEIDAKRTAQAKGDADKISLAYKNIQDTLKQLDDALKQQQVELTKAQQDLLDAKSADIGKISALVNDVTAARDKLVTLREKLKRMKERRARLDQLNEDGQVISANPDTNLAVVNLGARQGVRPGMLFDVFELKKDGRKIRKAKIRLQKVESQQSTAVILAARPVPKSCSQCGWATTDATVLFCPYCRGGEPPILPDVVRLVEGAASLAVVSPDFLNPVSKGDWISSPFYLGGKNRQIFNFAIAGQPVQHSRQEIYAFLKENGCKLAEDVTIDTDFAVVGTGPNVDDELKKARLLGVSILREQDLFNFFGQMGVASDVPKDEAEATVKG
jgi:NAD-dependent DNA ligase